MAESLRVSSGLFTVPSKQQGGGSSPGHQNFLASKPFRPAGGWSSYGNTWRSCITLLRLPTTLPLGLGTIFTFQISSLFWMLGLLGLRTWRYFEITCRKYGAKLFRWVYLEREGVHTLPSPSGDPGGPLCAALLVSFGFQGNQYKAAAWTHFYSIALGWGRRSRETRRRPRNQGVMGKVDHLRV